MQEGEPEDTFVKGADLELTRGVVLHQDAKNNYIEADAAERLRRPMLRRAGHLRCTPHHGDRVYFWRAEDPYKSRQTTAGMARRWRSKGVPWGGLVLLPGNGP